MVRLVIGNYHDPTNNVEDILTVVTRNRQSRVDFVIMPLISNSSHYHHSMIDMNTNDTDNEDKEYYLGLGTRNDLIKPTKEWSQSIVGYLSSFNNSKSNNSSNDNDNIVNQIKKEIAWAQHLGIQALIISLPPLPLSSSSILLPNFIRQLQHLSSTTYNYQQVCVTTTTTTTTTTTVTTTTNNNNDSSNNSSSNSSNNNSNNKTHIHNYYHYHHHYYYYHYHHHYHYYYYHSTGSDYHSTILIAIVHGVVFEI